MLQAADEIDDQLFAIPMHERIAEYELRTPPSESQERLLMNEGSGAQEPKVNAKETRVLALEHYLSAASIA